MIIWIMVFWTVCTQNYIAMCNLECAIQITHHNFILRTHGPIYRHSKDHSNCAIRIKIKITHFCSRVKTVQVSLQMTDVLLISTWEFWWSSSWLFVLVIWSKDSRNSESHISLALLNRRIYTSLVTSQFLISQYFDPTIYTCAKNCEVSASRNITIFWLVKTCMCEYLSLPLPGRNYGCLPCVYYRAHACNYDPHRNVLKLATSKNSQW